LDSPQTFVASPTNNARESAALAMRAEVDAAHSPAAPRPEPGLYPVRGGGGRTAASSSGFTDLLIEVRKGDEQAFARLYEACAWACFSLAVRVARDRDLAADIVQDTFIAVWCNSAAFDAEKGSAMTWVLTITHRKAVDVVRREERRRPPSRDQEHPRSSEPWVESGWLDHQRSEVRRVFASLRRTHREILALAYFGGLSQSEIAARLSIPIGTVKSRTRAALDELRGAIAAAGYDRDELLQQ
jgi:RNA polymerase sigma-70 factor (ECF subfamily)